MTYSMNHYRVLFVRPSFQRHGASKLVMNLAEELTNYDFNVEILAKSQPIQPVHLPRKPVESTIALRSKKSGFLELPTWLSHLIRSILKSDIIILSSENGLFWPSLISFFLHKPTLAIVQNNIQQSSKDHPSHARGRRIRTWAYAQAQSVICVSKTLVSTVEPEVSREKITSISNGIDIQRVRMLAQHPCPSILVTDNIPFIVGIGRLARQKGFDLLIKAHAALLQQGIHHQLVLLGEGHLHEDLVQLTEQLQVSNSVVFLGFLDNPYPVLARASLFCLSSRYEGASLCLAEAAVLGVPSVATDCMSGPREILADGQYGDLVEPESVDQLTKSIERHFKHPQRLIAKAQASAKQAHRLSMQACSRQYYELIHHCLTQR